MKRVNLVVFSILLIMSGVFIDRYAIKAKNAFASDDKLVIAQAVKKAPKKENEWVAKINDTTLTLNDFEREFGVHVYSLPIDKNQKEKYRQDSSNKKKFLSNLVNEYLIYQKALQEGYDKKGYVKDIVKAVTRRAIIQIYLNENIEPKLEDVSDEQIEEIYNRNKKLFAGVDIDVARQQIKMQILQKQYNNYLNELIDDLKGEAKVIKNEDINL